MTYRLVCLKHGRLLFVARTNQTVRIKGYTGHFHADVFACSRRGCSTQILVLAEGECFCQQPVQPRLFGKPGSNGHDANHSR